MSSSTRFIAAATSSAPHATSWFATIATLREADRRDVGSTLATSCPVVAANVFFEQIKRRQKNRRKAELLQLRTSGHQ